MSTSDVFTAVSSLVALGVAVAGATLFIIRTVKKKQNLSGRDIGIIRTFDSSYGVGSIGVIGGYNSDVIYGNVHVWTA